VTANSVDGIANLGLLTMRNSTVSAHPGLGILNGGNGTLVLGNSTVSGNAYLGIYNFGETILTNSTLSGNGSGAVGSAAINNYGTVSLTNCTVSGNQGAGVLSSTPSATLTNSIVANTIGGMNCFGFIVDGGNNFADDASCEPGFSDISPGVDFDTALADNGGPTLTHALLPLGVAVNAAGDCGLGTDQRGFSRNDTLCDSGSFELQCSITVTENAGQTQIFFMPSVNTFDVASGLLSDLLADGDFSEATCLGLFVASPAIDDLPEPGLGDGRYYVARGYGDCIGAGYGDSSLTPDPRDDLLVGPCP